MPFIGHCENPANISYPPCGDGIDDTRVLGDQRCVRILAMQNNRSGEERTDTTNDDEGNSKHGVTSVGLEFLGS
jgi:hypothetical protein